MLPGPARKQSWDALVRNWDVLGATHPVHNEDLAEFPFLLQLPGSDGHGVEEAEPPAKRELVNTRGTPSTLPSQHQRVGCPLPSPWTQQGPRAMNLEQSVISHHGFPSSKGTGILGPPKPPRASGRDPHMAVDGSA